MGINLIPMRVHIALDVLMGAFLAISPWIFNFSRFDANAWAPHLLVGILIMGYALATRTQTSDAMATA